MALRRAVHILEMNLATDHASEGRFVEQFIKVLNVPTHYKSITSGKQLMRELNRPDVRYIHISSHGTAINRDAAFTLPNLDVFDLEDVATLQGLLQGRVVVASGCYTGRVALARAMMETKCAFYIAPRRAISWPDAAIFEALLYRYHLQSGLPIPQAFELAKEHAQAQGDWQLYPHGCA